MKLVPCATVNMVYSETPSSYIPAPVFAVSDCCVYNQQAEGGVKFSAASDVHVLKPHETALMQYVEYRRNAVESS